MHSCSVASGGGVGVADRVGEAIVRTHETGFGFGSAPLFWAFLLTVKRDTQKERTTKSRNFLIVNGGSKAERGRRQALPE